MKIERLKVGQKVWVMKEFPEEMKIDVIDVEDNEVWCDDGWNYSVNHIYCSEARCKKAN